MNGKKTFLALLALMLVCTTFNLTKPFTIDDVASLEVASWICHNPGHPMSGEVNWEDDTARPIHELLHPHLLYFLQAMVITASGETEVPHHLLIAPMVLLILFSFHRLAGDDTTRYSLYLAALLVLGPAFLPAQNIMHEMPLLAAWLGFFALVLAEDHQGRNYLLAGFVAAIACLTKYNSLVLLPLLLVSIILRRRWKSLWAIAIPLTALVAWSAWNYLDYGGIHLLGRKMKEFTAAGFCRGSVDWIIGMGLAATFSIGYLPLIRSSTVARWWFAGSVAAGAAMAVIAARESSSALNSLLWGVYTTNGICAAVLAGRGFLLSIKAAAGTDGSERHRPLILLLWIVATYAFTVLVVPFMAVRHVLPALPALLLLAVRKDDLDRCLFRPAPAIVLTVAVGALAAVSDYQYAATYRQYAPLVRRSLPAEAKVWYAGHWGWQWYARKGGMVQYDAVRTVLHKGDYLVFPRVVDWRNTPQHHLRCIEKLKEIVVPFTPLSLLRTMGPEVPEGYYGYSLRWQIPPLSISTAPLEVFDVYAVVRDQQIPEKQAPL